MYDWWNISKTPFIVEEPHQASALSNRVNRVMFQNLVNLFTELVRADLFSHDAYLRTLISRGDVAVNAFQIFCQQQERLRMLKVAQQQQQTLQQAGANPLNLPANERKRAENSATVGFLTLIHRFLVFSPNELLNNG